MKLREIAEKLGLENLTPELTGRTAMDVQYGYVSDLLSDVLGNASPGSILVTVQVHMNVIAVAVQAELPAVLFASGRIPDEQVREKAVAEGIVLYGSREFAFDIAGKLYGLGLRSLNA